MNSKIAGIGVVILLISMPFALRAQVDPTTQIITLLQEIITLQVYLIESLQSEIVHLKNTLASASAQTGAKKCARGTPPLCATALTITRDSNNCITAYHCAAYAQGSYYSQASYYSQGSYGPTSGSASCLQSQPYWQGQGSTYPHEAVVCSAVSGCWHAARCCNGKWYAGGNIIGAGPNCAYWVGHQGF